MRHALIAALLGTACFSEEDDLGSTETSSSTSSTSTADPSSVTTPSGSTTNAPSSSGSDESSSSSTGAEPDTTSADESSSSSTGAEPIEDWALYFDQSAEVLSSNPIDLALDTDFTVELWARIDSADAHGALVAHRGVGTTGWILGLDAITSELMFGIYDNNGVWNTVVGSDVADLSPGWHHIAATKHGGTLYLHLDGMLDASAPCTVQISAPIVPLELGGIDVDTDQTGAVEVEFVALDDVRLSAIARYQAAFMPPVILDVDDDTRIYLPIDEGSGVLTLDDVDGVTFDLQATQWVPGNSR